MNITQWLKENGFGKYTELFKTKEITLEKLSDIESDDELSEIGIKSKYLRTKMLIEITPH